MQYSLAPDLMISIADSVRVALDDSDSRSTALVSAVDALGSVLAPVPGVPGALSGVVEPRVRLAGQLVGQGRAVLGVLGENLSSYLTADENMVSNVCTAEAPSGEPPLFDAARFSGVRR